MRLAGIVRWRSGGPNPAVRAALHAAHSDEPDDRAVQRLNAVAAGRRGDVRAALDFFAKCRDRFDMDRAYRLLEAAVNEEAVLPIRDDRREMFGEEERLGRMPLADAFAVLAECQPGLRELAARAEVRADSQTMAAQATEGSEDGPRASSMLLNEKGRSGGVCDSVLARSIAAQYLAILDGSDRSDPSCAYFALPRKRVVLASRFDSR
jgi:hypothetical protein